MKIIPYGRQYVDAADIYSISKSLRQSVITGGQMVDELEHRIGLFTESKFQISCNSGTSALLMAFMAIDIKKSDIIICPAINFTATNNILKNIGAKVYLADVDPETGQMTPENLLDCISKNNIKKIKAVVTMYLGGRPLNVENFFYLKKKFKFLLLEDACHALGSEYKVGNNFLKIGSCKHSDICLFSLHPLKTITAGEGGIFTTNSKKIYQRAKLFRSHGIVRSKNHYDYDVISSGLNLRLSDINCALAISQLKKINTFVKSRKKISNLYTKKLEKFSEFLSLPASTSKERSSHHLYQVNLKINKLKISRNDVINILLKNKIYTQIHYIPIYRHTNFRFLEKKSIINSEIFYKTTLSLPIFYKMTSKTVDFVVKRLGDIFNKYRNI